METSRLDWQALEARIPVGELPASDRAVLLQLYPNKPWETMLLRKAQGKLQTALRQLERDGLARHGQGLLWVAATVIPEAFSWAGYSHRLGYLP